MTTGTTDRARGRGLLGELLTPAGLHDPYAVHARIRARAEAGDDVGRLVVRHREVVDALRDPLLSADRVDAIWRPLPADGRGGPAERLMRDIVVFRDPPDHTRLRRLLLTAFTRAEVGRHREEIARWTGQLLDRLAGSTDPDLHREVSYPLPALVVAALLGIPDSHRTAFEGWALDLVHVTGSGRLTPELARRLADDVAELRGLVTDLVTRRRRDPGPDLLSAMAATDGLTDDEIVANSLFLMTAGHETAANQLSNAVLALLRHPDRLAALRADPGLVDGAVEELLRYDSAVQMTARTARADTAVGGRPVRAGESVVLLLGAANRDPAVFADPDVLDLRRPNAARHVAFGFGPHHCLGAALARVELRVALPLVLARFPGLALAAEPVRYQPTLDFRGPERLAVTW